LRLVARKVSFDDFQCARVPTCPPARHQHRIAVCVASRAVLFLIPSIPALSRTSCAVFGYVPRPRRLSFAFPR
jgi:hypothetical protein